MDKCKKVIAVFKTHVDIGFTDLPHIVLEKYSSGMLNDIVSTCEKSLNNPKNMRFIWTMPAFVLKYTLENSTEELRKRAERLIKNRILVWHALPLTVRTEFFTGYELRKLLKFGKELSIKYNTPMPISAKMTDVPGHTMALIDALCENDIKFLHLGCNPASTRPDVPELFWWKSKNGNKILTFYNKDYGNGVIPPKDWDYPVYLSMNVSGDNSGIQGSNIIFDLENELHEFNAGIEFTTGTMDDFAREILNCDLSNLPTIEGELGDTWIHSLGAFPESCIAVGNVRKDFEKISKFLESKNDYEFSKLQEKYIENLMLFGEHSGGVSSSVFIRDNRKYKKPEFLDELQKEQFSIAENGWNDERNWALTAEKTVKALKEKVENKYGISFTDEILSSNNNFEISKGECGIEIYNRKLNKKIQIGYFYEVIGKKRIDDYLDSYLTMRCWWSLCDFARYTPDGKNNYPNIKDKFFESVPKYKVLPNKIIAEYIPKKESYEKFGNAEKVIITATKHEDGVKIKVELINKQPTMYSEAGHICFDTGGKIKNIRICKSGVEINPETDIVKGANTALFACSNYVLTDDLKFVSNHAPLCSFGGSKIYRNNTETFKNPENGKLLFNLFNTMWATGAPQWLYGSYTYEFIIAENTFE